MDIDGLRQRWVKDHWWFFLSIGLRVTPKQNQTATTGTWTTDLSLSGWVCYHYATVAADSLLEQECSKLEHGMINSTLIQKVRGLHTCPECEGLWFKLWQFIQSLPEQSSSSVPPMQSSTPSQTNDPGIHLSIGVVNAVPNPLQRNSPSLHGLPELLIRDSWSWWCGTEKA